MLLVVYLAGTRALYRHSRRDAAIPPAAAQAAASPTTLRSAALRFTGAAIAVVLTAPVFAWSAKRVAELSGLGATFVGTWLVGLSTSLPELVASLAAVRLGALDLAVGNLFGSNAFNMVVFVALDVAHRGGAIFATLASDHALSALFAVVLMALGLAAIVYRAERRFWMLEPDSALIAVVYALGILLLYVRTAGG